MAGVVNESTELVMLIFHLMEKSGHSLEEIVMAKLNAIQPEPDPQSVSEHLK